MTQQVELQKLNQLLEPLCPRDSRVMHYHAKGLAWRQDGQLYSTPSYLCQYEGCSVRYAPANGYFSVLMTPDLPQAVEEPGVNLLKCPEHDVWLYRAVAENIGDKLIWRCGVEGCDYVHADCGPAWPSF